MKLGSFRALHICLAVMVLPSSVMAATCDGVLNSLKQERHLTQVRQTDGKRLTEFQDGPSITLSVSCALGAPTLAVTWDGPEPDQQYYDLVGRAGGLLSSHSPAGIVKASKQCRSEALSSGGEIASIEEEGLALECQAFARDGGSTTISVFAE
ncbi:hypothetical protein H7A76_31680 [Pseudomonas sp. MSSRFD41]|uniref:hypothetical protein n=1 Tax=Pseudomonas sp. MSSRFD41 TaxID=1310370 RepID=UPI00163A8765|nr:hypothetical protein [Pseudomonas sp. MSSRFD41]MBC2660014.1 hypothetical protein [Pseudomonas sp. MSSRFD41]